MQDRLKKLRQLYAAWHIEALLVSDPKNIFYLSGFTGTTAFLIVDEQEAHLLTDFRYVEQARDQCPHCTVREVKGDYLEELVLLLSHAGISALGFEANHLVYNQYFRLKEKLSTVQLVPTTGMVEGLRVLKEPGEIKAVEESAAILDSVLTRVMSKVKPGMTELELALELEFKARQHGAEDKAFPFIVASGPRAALPHGIASGRAIQEGDLLIIDFGVYYRGYASDMTRTLVVGKPQPRQEELYRIVLEAQLAGLSRVKAGVRAGEVDKAARDVIAGYGYVDRFGHATGHGVGLEVHEKPRLSQKDDTILEPGMVITIEPGIYIPGWGGIRIEDTVVVEERGGRVLCNSPKERLICL